MLSFGEQATGAARPWWPSVHPFSGIALPWGCGGRALGSLPSSLNTYCVQGARDLSVSGSPQLSPSAPPPLDPSISRSPAWLTGNTAREVKSPGFQSPVSAHHGAVCEGGAEASCLQESQGPSGAVPGTGSGAAPRFWLRGRGLGTSTGRTQTVPHVGWEVRSLRILARPRTVGRALPSVSFALEASLVVVVVGDHTGHGMGDDARVS